MVDLSLLYGNEHIKRILNGSGNFSSFLIEGPEGSGRHTLAKLITASRLCLDAGATKPCGKCTACKKLGAGMHIDVKIIDGEFSVDEIREKLEDLNTYPADGPHKVYIIENADALNALKQNTLLKSLEEPPEFVTFILIAHSVNAFLQTVISRCTVFSMRPLSDELLEKGLRERIPEPDEDNLRRAVVLSGGFLGAALRLYGGEGNRLSDSCIAFCDAFLRCDWYGMLGILTSAEASDTDIKKKKTKKTDGKQTRRDFTEFITALERYIKRCFDYVAAGKISELDEKERALAGIGEDKLSQLCGAVARTAANNNINVNLNLWSVYTVQQCRKIR